MAAESATTDSREIAKGAANKQLDQLIHDLAQMPKGTRVRADVVAGLAKGIRNLLRFA